MRGACIQCAHLSLASVETGGWEWWDWIWELWQQHVQESSRSVGAGWSETWAGCDKESCSSQSFFGIEVWTDTAKLANMVIARFEDRWDLVRKSEVFIKYEANDNDDYTMQCRVMPYTVTKILSKIILISVICKCNENGNCVITIRIVKINYPCSFVHFIFPCRPRPIYRYSTARTIIFTFLAWFIIALC